MKGQSVDFYLFIISTFICFFTTYVSSTISGKKSLIFILFSCVACIAFAIPFSLQNSITPDYDANLGFLKDALNGNYRYYLLSSSYFYIFLIKIAALFATSPHFCLLILIGISYCINIALFRIISQATKSRFTIKVLLIFFFISGYYINYSNILRFLIGASLAFLGVIVYIRGRRALSLLLITCAFMTHQTSIVLPFLAVIAGPFSSLTLLVSNIPKLQKNRLILSFLIGTVLLIFIKFDLTFTILSIVSPYYLAYLQGNWLSSYSSSLSVPPQQLLVLAFLFGLWLYAVFTNLSQSFLLKQLNAESRLTTSIDSIFFKFFLTLPILILCTLQFPLMSRFIPFYWIASIPILDSLSTRGKIPGISIYIVLSILFFSVRIAALPIYRSFEFIGVG